MFSYLFYLIWSKSFLFRFQNTWEQRKLGEVFSEYSEKNHEELPALTIIQGKGTIRRDESDRNLQYDEKGLKNYKLVKENDFIVHLRSFEGGLEKANSNDIITCHVGGVPYRADVLMVQGYGIQERNRNLVR